MGFDVYLRASPCSGRYIQRNGGRFASGGKLKQTSRAALSSGEGELNSAVESLPEGIGVRNALKEFFVEFFAEFRT